MTLVDARGDRVRPESVRVSRIVARFVVTWWKLAVSAELVSEFGGPGSLRGSWLLVELAC